MHLLTTFGGPIRLPGLRTRATFSLGYQRTTDHSASTQLPPSTAPDNVSFAPWLLP